MNTGRASAIAGADGTESQKGRHMSLLDPGTSLAALEVRVAQGVPPYRQPALASFAAPVWQLAGSLVSEAVSKVVSAQRSSAEAAEPATLETEQLQAKILLDLIAKLDKIDTEAMEFRRSQGRTGLAYFWLGAALSVPVGLLGSYAAHLLGW